MKCASTSLLASLAVVAGMLFVARASAADEPTVITPFNGKDLDGWTCKGRKDHANWKVGIAKLDPADPSQLIVEPAPEGKGEMVNSPAHSVDIATKQEFGDCTLDLELMVPRGSNSGVYLMGEYEIQVLDSFGRKQLRPGDMGGLYGVAPPKVNASKAPGEWQQLRVEFRAPRFEGDKKVANAKLVKVVLNGQIIHENLEIPGKCGGDWLGREVPVGPLMFQGNHGAVAFRNIKITINAKK